jgi:hypothetical protein
LQHIALSMHDGSTRRHIVHDLIASLPNLRSVDCLLMNNGPKFGLTWRSRRQGIEEDKVEKVEVGENGTLDGINLKRVEEILKLTLPRCLIPWGGGPVADTDIHELLGAWQRCGKKFRLTLVSSMHAWYKVPSKESIPGCTLVSISSSQPFMRCDKC